jgi:uncharacterized protein VirK/YbjX
MTSIQSRIEELKAANVNHHDGRLRELRDALKVERKLHALIREMWRNSNYIRRGYLDLGAGRKKMLDAITEDGI